MTGLTTWQTDDPCPACGAHLTEISGPSSTRVIQQCRACAWSVTWAAPQLVLTAASGLPGRHGRRRDRPPPRRRHRLPALPALTDG